MWIAQLYEIYEFVRREIQLIKNNSNPNFSNYISELAVTIFSTVSLFITQIMNLLKTNIVI